MRNLSALSILIAVVALSACAKARQVEEGRSADCTGCHGGQDNQTGAPPFDTHGASTSAAVGAHTAHLDAGVRCDGCHIVPTDAASPGHMDTGPAEVTFGAVAGPDAVYDYTTHSCSSVYCHAPPTAPGGAAPVPSWNGTLAGGPCGSCHADPPTSHGGVADTLCEKCHATSIVGAGPSRAFVSGGTHANGTVEPASISCTTCHGDAARLPAGEQLADAAPPVDAQGLSSSAAVGAHLTHLFGRATGAISNGFACTSCHAVPTSPFHSNATVDVVLRDPNGATSGTHTPSGTGGTCSTYCHGNPGGNTANAPAWNGAGTQSACDVCHGNSPPTGHHPSVFSQHAWMGTDCQYCHYDVATTGAIKPGGLGLHVNGTKDVRLTNTSLIPGGSWNSQTMTCAPQCHGSRSW